MSVAPAVMPRWIALCDAALRLSGRVFSVLCSLCLLAMLVLTAVTIVTRPMNLGLYWIFPWVMVLFVWLSFFGFFAAMVRGRDVRIDFIARLFGDRGMAATRIVAQVVLLGVTGVLLWEMPTVLATQTGKIDGVIVPFGGEMPRQALSIPLLLSCVFIALAVLLDVARLILGLPEVIGDQVAGTRPEG